MKTIKYWNLKGLCEALLVDTKKGLTVVVPDTTIFWREEALALNNELYERALAEGVSFVCFIMKKSKQCLLTSIGAFGNKAPRCLYHTTSSRYLPVREWHKDGI